MKYLKHEYCIDRFSELSQFLEALLDVWLYSFECVELTAPLDDEYVEARIKKAYAFEKRLNALWHDRTYGSPFSISAVGLDELSDFEQLIACHSPVALKAAEGIGGRSDTSIHMLALSWIDVLYSKGDVDLSETDVRRLMAMVRLERLHVLDRAGRSAREFAPHQVTINQVCGLVKRDRKTVEATKHRWPEPIIPHKGSRAAVYEYRPLYPILIEEFPDAALVPPKQS